MRHYNVNGVSARRVNFDDGAVEYRVQWEGYDALCDTWEPRPGLLPHCAAPLGETDAREHTATLRRVESWAEGRGALKRAREETPERGTPPPLCGILVHSRACGSGEEAEVTSLVALGDQILADDISYGLNLPKKKKVPGRVGPGSVCDPALRLEKCWQDQHAVSFMHNCVSAACCAPAVSEFELGTCRDRCRDASSIEIHGIAPVALVKSGQAYDTATGCEPLIGREEAARLRSQCNFNPVLASTTQAFVRGKRDQLVVRYFLTETTDENDRKLFTMPLSVFRHYYPQLLLDFLLRHALVMESS